MQKNDSQISDFAFAEKTPSPLKSYFWEKIVPAYSCEYNLQSVVRRFFKKLNRSRVGFTFWKLVLYSKINKAWTTKIQENCAYLFKENYLINHHV